MNDDLPILLFDRQELISRTLAQRLGWLVRRMCVLGLRRKWNRGHDRDARLDARLTKCGKQSDFIDRVQADAVCYVAQKSFGSLDHTGSFDV